MTPKHDKIKTVDAGKAERQGRLNKAQQFLQAADDLRSLYEDDSVVEDTAVTLYVHAGIAAADVICAVSLGKYAQGDSHQDAVKLLASADAAAAKLLDTLLHMKTRAGYGFDPISNTKLIQAERAARRSWKRHLRNSGAALNEMTCGLSIAIDAGLKRKPSC